MTVRTSHLRLALIALGAAVLYNVWYFALRPAPKPPGRTTAESALLAVPAISPAALAVLDPLAVPVPQRVELSAPIAFVRDPFLFGDETRRASAPAVRSAVTADPVVRSILYSADRRLAIVDGRIVGIGEQVGSFTVSDIERDTVVFTTPAGVRLRVSVHEGPATGQAP
jgi:hypothetical protein